MAKKKEKSFVEDLNPAMEFISNKEAITAPSASGEQIRFVYATPERERKTRRFQLLLKPSLYDKLKAAAEADNASVNDYVCAILEYALEGK